MNTQNALFYLHIYIRYVLTGHTSTLQSHWLYCHMLAISHSLLYCNTVQLKDNHTYVHFWNRDALFHLVVPGVIITFFGIPSVRITLVWISKYAVPSKTYLISYIHQSRILKLTLMGVWAHRSWHLGGGELGSIIQLSYHGWLNLNFWFGFKSLIYGSKETHYVP